MQLVLTSNKRINYFSAIFLILIAIISLFPRIKYIEECPSPNNIGHIYTITTINTWIHNGISNNYFSPVLTHANQGDKGVYEYKRLTDEEGNNYFVSFPPFSFILAYTFSNFFNFININYLLSALAILSHLITALFIFLSIKKLSNSRNFINTITAIFGFCIIMFSPALLFHSLSWFPEMFVLALWAFFIYFIINIKANNKILSINFIIALLTGFLLCYTDWLGYLIIFSFIIYILFFNTNKLLRKIGIYLFLGGLIAFIITIFQYSQIDGFESLLRAWGLRFAERSGLLSQSLSDQGLNWLNINTWVLALQRFREIMPGMGYLTLFLISISIFLSNKKDKKETDMKFLIFIILMPVILHFIILLNSNIIHIGGWAKLFIPLAFFAAISLNKIFIKFDNVHINYLITGITAGIILATIVSFSNFNNINKKYPSKELFAEQINAIKQNAKQDEVIFIKYDKLHAFYLPYIEYSTTRSICTAIDKKDAEIKLTETKHSKGKFFNFEMDNNKLNTQIILITSDKYDF